MRTAMMAGETGEWTIDEIRPVRGQGLAAAPRLRVAEATLAEHMPSAWRLDGVVSNIRYATAAEAAGLRAVQAGLGRDAARCAVLIPIAKSAAWWALAQDERRAIFEETSHHTAIGMDYLPAVARRLYHSRDLGEPFDFLTWFEFAPEHAEAFDELLVRLRATAEWTFVAREVEIRLSRP
jgi:chlorite dismutase